MAGELSSEADSHLVCVEKAEGVRQENDGEDWQTPPTLRTEISPTRLESKKTVSFAYLKYAVRFFHVAEAACLNDVYLCLKIIWIYYND